ncbi:MAG: SRPBCC family protein [Steroidobacteraceae bacterium]
MGIHQEVRIKVGPEKIYVVLTSGKEFSQVTGAPADLAAVEGGAFSLFGGEITGRNIELTANEGLVQAWRAGMWPKGVYSIVRITLEKAGDETKVTLDQSGFPEGAAEHLEGGWHKMYWQPLKAYLE